MCIAHHSKLRKGVLLVFFACLVATFFALDDVQMSTKSIPFIFYFSKTSLKSSLPLSRIFPLFIDKRWLFFLFAHRLNSLKVSFSSSKHIAFVLQLHCFCVVNSLLLAHSLRIFISFASSFKRIVQ